MKGTGESGRTGADDCHFFFSGIDQFFVSQIILKTKITYGAFCTVYGQGFVKIPSIASSFTGVGTNPAADCRKGVGASQNMPRLFVIIAFGKDPEEAPDVVAGWTSVLLRLGDSNGWPVISRTSSPVESPWGNSPGVRLWLAGIS